MLEYLSDKFSNSSLKVKIELYLLPIFIFFLIYILFYEQKINIKTNKEIVLHQEFTEELQESSIKLLSTIHEISNNNNITILIDENTNNIVYLKGKSKRIDLFNFIKHIENINNFSNIIELNINKINNEEIYYFEIKIDFNNYYIKNLQVINLANKYELTAIVDDFALINGIWFKKNDEIDDYKLFELDMDYVILYKNNKTIKLEIDHGTYFKNIY